MLQLVNIKGQRNWRREKEGSICLNYLIIGIHTAQHDE